MKTWISLWKDMVNFIKFHSLMFYIVYLWLSLSFPGFWKWCSLPWNILRKAHGRVWNCMWHGFTSSAFVMCLPLTEIRMCVHEVCPEGIQPCTMTNRDIYWGRYRKQETLYIGQWCLSPLQSRHLGTSHSSPSHHQLPHNIFLNLINSPISLPFQR